jgi:hypothetical protein
MLLRAAMPVRVRSNAAHVGKHTQMTTGVLPRVQSVELPYERLDLSDLAVVYGMS